MSEKTSTFLVTHADDDSAVLRDVADSQIHTLSGNPGVDELDVMDATLAPEPPLEATWTVVDVENRRAIPVERADEPPTTKSKELAADQDDGGLTRMERAGIGEVHVLTVPPEETDAAVSDVIEDEETVARAGRLDVNRVEIRAEDGVIAVRYLP